jgi:phosphatidylglycerol---prolipoprotein diacylglyceryl transferase
MIDPIIFTIDLGSFTFSLHWYGVLVMLGVVVGAYIAGLEIQRRGGNPEHLWDGLLWALPAGILGARLWYCATDILGGNSRYLDNPLRIINITEGGLHFYGGILFAGVVFYFYTRYHKIDLRLIVDAVGPSLLIGQAVARPANFINQELYGQPTDLPWGISISQHSRISPWNDMLQFPEATTRFHPTFAYEIILNLFAAALLIWIAHRFTKKIRPGSIFLGWLIFEGIGRVILENFRPDQPRFAGTDLSYSSVVAAAMAFVGIIVLLIKYEIIRLPGISSGPKTYKIQNADGERAISPELNGDEVPGDDLSEHKPDPFENNQED